MAKTKKEILETLNEEQQKPVLSYKGPSLIVAGPGSGKSHTICSRTAYMIEDGVNPENILLFTFTKKAAGELRERVQDRIGKKAEGITVGTYHSVCSRLLRKYCTFLGYEPSFSIYDEEDKNGVLKDLLKGSDIKASYAIHKISEWKSKMWTPSVALKNAENSFEETAAVIYEHYENKMMSLNAFDFDDLIYKTIKILDNFPGVRKEINERYHYIMADEFQDSSEMDITFIRLMTGEAENVCVIMDDEQSIYGFRGANIDAVLKISEYFPDMRNFVLSRNYRSTKNIVSASRSLIAHNTSQIQKEVYTDNEEGEKIHYFECRNNQDEAVQVVKIIKTLQKHMSYCLSDIAILYRMSFLSRALEETFLRNNIQYEMVGGTPFYARKEIKDVMGYLRFAFNPQDAQSFERIVNTPKRNIGKRALETIYGVANSMNCDTIVLIEACKVAPVKGKARKELDQFIAIINHLREMISTNSHPEDVIKYVLDKTGYRKHLIDTEEDAEERIANIMELQSIASNSPTIEDFIYSMALNNDVIMADESVEKVKMLTMHSSKGLEFKAVIVVGANEGVSPHWKAETLSAMEEERRLFYVAMTRAEKMLFITRSRITSSGNGGGVSVAKESKFIGEIDERYLIKA